MRELQIQEIKLTRYLGLINNLSMKNIEEYSFSKNKKIYTTYVTIDNINDISSIEEFLLKINILNEEELNEKYKFPHVNIVETVKREIIQYETKNKNYLLPLMINEFELFILKYLENKKIKEFNIKLNCIKEVFFIGASKISTLPNYDVMIFFILDNKIYCISNFYYI